MSGAREYFDASDAEREVVSAPCHLKTDRNRRKEKKKLWSPPERCQCFFFYSSYSEECLLFHRDWSFGASFICYFSSESLFFFRPSAEQVFFAAACCRHMAKPVGKRYENNEA